MINRSTKNEFSFQAIRADYDGTLGKTNVIVAPRVVHWNSATRW